jgi:hypothetical protein
MEDETLAHCSTYINEDIADKQKKKQVKCNSKTEYMSSAEEIDKCGDQPGMQPNR